jgi:hypothetical protein
VIENFGRLRKQAEIRRFMLAKGYQLLARIWISDDIFAVDPEYVASSPTTTGMRRNAEGSGE